LALPARYAVVDMEIRNTTKRPLKVSLPQGKKLFLGPNATASIAAKALEHPPVIALIEKGDIEVVGKEGGQTPGAAGGDKGGASAQTGRGGGSAMRRSGDR